MKFWFFFPNTGFCPNPGMLGPFQASNPLTCVSISPWTLAWGVEGRIGRLPPRKAIFWICKIWPKSGGGAYKFVHEKCAVYLQRRNSSWIIWISEYGLSWQRHWSLEKGAIKESHKFKRQIVDKLTTCSWKVFGCFKVFGKFESCTVAPAMLTKSGLSGFGFATLPQWHVRARVFQCRKKEWVGHH